MRYWAHQGLATAVLALISICPARALDMPGPSAQEVLVKSMLVTLNDAVASDNFTVLHAKIDEKGVLKLKGRFQTAPKQVKYQLGFIESEGAWKLSGVQIDIE